MPKPTTERRSLLATVSFAIGAALTALVFWILGRIVRPRRAQPLLPSVGPTGPAYEQRDVSARALTLVALGFLVALGVAVAFATVLFLAFTGVTPTLQAPPPGLAISAQAPTPQPPPPRLETQPGQEMTALRAQEDLVLNSYAWVDQSHGIVRIPIDRAMDLVAASGLPTRPSTQSTGYQDQALTSPTGSSSGRVAKETPR